MKIKQLAVAGMIGVAAFAGSMFGAELAKADPSQDAAYLDFLAQQGGPVGLTYDSADIAIAQGRATCDLLDAGYSIDQTVNAADAVYDVNWDGAVVVVAAAIYAYCPQHDPRYVDVLA